MATLLIEERRHRIAQQLLLDKRISAKELAQEFNVSTETIRKDLLHLEKEGIAKKGYGGAVVANELLELGFMEKAASHPAEKAAIGRRAAELVADGSVVFLDSGSTTLEVAKQLTLRKDITVFTNSLKAAQVLTDAGVRTCILGGEIKPTSKAVIGGWAERQLAEIQADIAFLGTSGFRHRDGPCIENLSESDIKKAMIARSYRTVVVADGSKASEDAMVCFAPWRDIDVLVTDAGMPEAERLRLGGMTEVVLA